MAAQHPKALTVTQTALFLTRCTDLCSSLAYITLWVPQSVYMNYEEPWCLEDTVNVQFRQLA